MTLHVSKHSNQLCSVILVNFYNVLNNDVIMSSLVSTGNCKLGHTADGCVHTDDTTKLSPTSCEFVFTPPTQRDETVLSRRRRRCVLGFSSPIIVLPTKPVIADGENRRTRCFCALVSHRSTLNTAGNFLLWLDVPARPAKVTSRKRCVFGNNALTRSDAKRKNAFAVCSTPRRFASLAPPSWSYHKHTRRAVSLEFMQVTTYHAVNISGLLIYFIIAVSS